MINRGFFNISNIFANKNATNFQLTTLEQAASYELTEIYIHRDASINK